MATHSILQTNQIDGIGSQASMEWALSKKKEQTHFCVFVDSAGARQIVSHWGKL